MTTPGTARERLDQVERNLSHHGLYIEDAVAVAYDDLTNRAGERRELVAKDLRELAAEIERMRGALEQIADGSAPPIPHGHYLAHRHAVNLARAALSAKAE